MKRLLFGAFMLLVFSPLLPSELGPIDELVTPVADSDEDDAMDTLLGSLENYRSSQSEQSFCAIVLAINNPASKKHVLKDKIRTAAEQALMCAAFSGNADLADVLMQTFKLDCNAQTAKSKLTPLMLAAQKNTTAHRNTVFKLMHYDEGFPLAHYSTIKDAENLTALQHAYKSGHPDTVTLLKGCSVSSYVAIQKAVEKDLDPRTTKNIKSLAKPLNLSNFLSPRG